MCDNKYLVGLASTLYFAGVLVGGAVFGLLADSYGRKLVLLVTLYSYIAISVGVYFTDSITSFIVLRTIVGFLVQVSIVSWWMVYIHRILCISCALKERDLSKEK